MIKNIDINKENDFSELINIMKEDAGGKLDRCNIHFNRLFIGNREAENELMIRLNEHEKTLVVARIAFTNQRKGYGEKILHALKRYGLKHGYTQIKFECVLTDSLKNFCKKHGFEPLQDNHFGFELDWVKPIN